MSNIYNDHLNILRNIKINFGPAISIYIPLKSSLCTPQKTFSSLIKTADNLLVKDGYPKLKISAPEWEKWIKQGTATLAIFHYLGFTHIVSLPIVMHPRVVVANSFHIKPIVNAANEFIDALMVHFFNGGASLYRVNATEEFLIDTYIPNSLPTKIDWPYSLERIERREFLIFIQNELKKNINDNTRFISITGADYPELTSETFWKNLKLPIFYLNDSFKFPVPYNGITMMKVRLTTLIKNNHLEVIQQNSKNIPLSTNTSWLKELTQKILNKKIKHICVSLDEMIFGELNPESGKTVIHKRQSNIKDDDLLDDLIELALDNGIKVSVIPEKFLPFGSKLLVS
jgi:hypothetical protein